VEGQSSGKQRVTIREAATLLGVHPNTVRSRIKDGSIEAEKVITERGPTWMIDPDSLTTNTPPSDSQQLVGRVPQEALTILAREIVREAGIAKDPEKDPEREARLEGNKLAMEAAKTQVLVSSGLLVGMTALAGVWPQQALKSPLLYLAIAFVITSVYGGILWMRDISRVTARSEGNPLGRSAALSTSVFTLGLVIYAFWVALNSPSVIIMTEEALLAGLGFVALLVAVMVTIAFLRRRRRAERR
jgi:excisionase family DNA binding protein